MISLEGLNDFHGFAGGGSHRFNHFLAELTARPDLFVPNGTRSKKKQRSLDLSKSLWQLYRLGFDFGVGMWYSEEKEGSAPGHLHLWHKAVTKC